MNLPAYLPNAKSEDLATENYQQELNQTLRDTLGPNGWSITNITATDLTTTPILDPNSGMLTTIKDLMPIGTAWFVTGTDLGAPVILGTGVLSPTELIVNTVDLAGTYTSIAALVNYINTGVVAGVTAIINGGDFVLEGVVPIVVSTAGTVGANGLNFANFDLTGGPLSKTLAPNWVGKQSAGPTVLVQFSNTPWP